MPGDALIVAGNPLIRVKRRQTEDPSSEEPTFNEAMAATRKLKLNLGYDAESDLKRLLQRIRNLGPGWNNNIPCEAQSSYTIKGRL